MSQSDTFVRLISVHHILICVGKLTVSVCCLVLDEKRKGVYQCFSFAGVCGNDTQQNGKSEPKM